MPGPVVPRGPVGPMGPSTEVGVGMRPMADTREAAAAETNRVAQAAARDAMVRADQQASANLEATDPPVTDRSEPAKDLVTVLTTGQPLPGAPQLQEGAGLVTPKGEPLLPTTQSASDAPPVDTRTTATDVEHASLATDGSSDQSAGQTGDAGVNQPIPTTPDHPEPTDVHPAPTGRIDQTDAAHAASEPPERGGDSAPATTVNGQDTRGAAPPPVDAQTASLDQAKVHSKAVGEHIQGDKGLQDVLGSDYDRLMTDMFGTKDQPKDLDLQAAVDRLKGSTGTSEQRLLQRLREADAITGMEEGQATLDSLKSRTDKDSPDYERAERDARKQISEGKKALRNIDVREQVAGDERIRQLLEDRGIDVQALNVEDAITMLRKRITDAGEHADAMDIRALNRLYEAQGIASLHEGQQELQRLREGEKAAVGDKQGEERDKAIEQYRKDTQGEYEEAKKTVEEGRPYQTQKELRERLRERLPKDPKLRRQLEEFAGEKVDVEDLDVAKFIKHLESLDSRTWGNDASMKGRAQELHDSLAHMRDDVRKDYFMEDMKTGRSPEEQKAAFEGLAEASKYEPGRIKRFRDWLGEKTFGFSHEQMKYLRRQAKNYKEGIKSMKEELKNPKLSAEDRATLEANLESLKKLHGSARKELIGKNILKALIFLILFNTLALTLGPTLLAAKMFQLAGKAPQ